MNREQAKKLLPIIQAFADGADLEFNDGRRWSSCDDPKFYSGVEWRIKPKPREEWKIVDKDGRGWGEHANADTAQHYADRCAHSVPFSAPFRIVHMREVTE